YLLSPQDLAGIDVLPELIRVGVASLKIEGRLKSPEYVASITRVYRGALDRAMKAVTSGVEAGNGGTGGDDPKGVQTSSGAKDRYELEMSFSRGLYTGWFRGIDNQKLAHGRFGTKRGVCVGTIDRVGGESVSLTLQAPLKAGDGVVFDAGTPEIREEGGRVYQVEVKGTQATLRFGQGDIDFRRISPGNRLWKTNDPALDREVRATFAGDKVRFQRPVIAEVHGRVNLPLTLLLDDGEGHVVKHVSAMVLVAAEMRPLNEEILFAQLSRLGGTPFKLGRLENRLEGDVMLPLSELNRLRRDGVAELEALRARPHRWALKECGEDVTAVAPNSQDSAPAGQLPELIATIRERAQLEPAWKAGARTIYCEFENPKHYRDTVVAFRELQAAGSGPGPASIWVAPPRIFKAGEEWILKQVRSCDADGYLVRNHDHLAFFADDRKRGDFSLNVANPLTAEYFVRRYGLERVTASYDLNVSQVESLLRGAPPGWFDLTIHKHMPMFHMEHCVFCAFLSSGKDYRDCGRPCDRHQVVLRDRVGADLPLKADAGCRNTVYNNRAQTGAEYVSRFLELGARSFRVEFVSEGAEEVFRTVTRYAQLLRGEIPGSELWRELKLLNQMGVTRGQMEAAPQVIRRKG
ncbi:MAG: DUF3656 domain-containing protein, partial [Opitutaceae bacterium]|nr:DUF3656 domain-containing protein [Opitutaceae bacterium]